MMKKGFAMVVAIALAMSFAATAAFAAAQPHGARFVDANGDGVCDVCASADANGDGVCDGCPFGGAGPQDGTGYRAGCGGCGRGNAGRGAGYVDSNGDGVCDNAASCPRGGCGRQGWGGRNAK